MVFGSRKTQPLQGSILPVEKTRELSTAPAPGDSRYADIPWIRMIAHEWVEAGGLVNGLRMVASPGRLKIFGCTIEGTQERELVWVEEAAGGFVVTCYADAKGKTTSLPPIQPEGSVGAALASFSRAYSDAGYPVPIAKVEELRRARRILPIPGAIVYVRPEDIGSMGKAAMMAHNRGAVRQSEPAIVPRAQRDGFPVFDLRPTIVELTDNIEKFGFSKADVKNIAPIASWKDGLGVGRMWIVAMGGRQTDGAFIAFRRTLSGEVVPEHWSASRSSIVPDDLLLELNTPSDLLLELNTSSAGGTQAVSVGPRC
jgi:hypothetical protein